MGVVSGVFMGCEELGEESVNKGLEGSRPEVGLVVLGFLLVGGVCSGGVWSGPGLLSMSPHSSKGG